MNSRKKESEENPISFENEKLQHFSDIWFSQRRKATIEQKNSVGLVYVSKFLKLGDNIAKRFADGDIKANHIVGMKQRSIPSNADAFNFWQEMRKIFPDVYSDEGIEFLVGNKGDAGAVHHFMFQLEIPLAEDSPILRDLALNAHIYK